MSSFAISVQGVSKQFSTPQGIVPILDSVSFAIMPGEKVAIVGPSGSGKSTLLSLLAGLDTPTSGDIKVQNIDVHALSEDKRSDFLNTRISIIFQSFELIAPFTVVENVRAPLDIRGVVGADADKIVARVLESVGLSHRAHALPYTLSGGEKQRVAIARALASDAEVILADEPTGSLDRHTGETVLALLLKEVREYKKTLVVITHDMTIAEQMDRVLMVRDGRVVEEK